MNALARRTTVTFLTLVAVQIGCARVDSRRFEPGRTTGSQLRNTLGPPQHEITLTQPEEESSHWLYADGVSFQIEGGRLTSRNRLPDGSERNLQYWRLRWRGRVQYEGSASGGATDAHADTLRSLVCPEDRTVVFYRPGDGRIIQVTEYAAR